MRQSEKAGGCTRCRLRYSRKAHGSQAPGEEPLPSPEIRCGCFKSPKILTVCIMTHTGSGSISEAPSIADREKQVPVFQFRKNTRDTKKNSLDHFNADVGGHGSCLASWGLVTVVCSKLFLMDACQQLRRCQQLEVVWVALIVNIALLWLCIPGAVPNRPLSFCWDIQMWRQKGASCYGMSFLPGQFQDFLSSSF